MPSNLPSLEIVLSCSALMGAVTAFVAHTYRGRRLVPWFLLGFCFGCFALLTLFLLPKRGLQVHPVLAGESSSLSTIPALIHDTTPMTQELWYFLTDSHEQTGPVSFQGLKKHFSEGHLRHSSYVWNERLEEWKKLEELPEYLSLLEESPT